jgi:CheY-like chemotaxis protein
MSASVDTNVVLVVDDEIFARLLAVQVLLDSGFTVLEAENAGEGLAMLDRNDDVGLLFTDISMPGEMDGLGLIARVRAHNPAIAMVVTSGGAPPRPDSLAGAPFLAKPYTAGALLAAIAEAIGTATAPPAPVLHPSRIG